MKLALTIPWSTVPTHTSLNDLFDDLLDELYKTVNIRRFPGTLTDTYVGLLSVAQLLSEAGDQNYRYIRTDCQHTFGQLNTCQVRHRLVSDDDVKPTRDDREDFQGLFATRYRSGT